jgi:broad-specificity NMP kinase
VLVCFCALKENRRLNNCLTNAVMVVLINGSFGVGKTTIAKLLREALPGSAIYDPELVGFVLMRAGKFLRLAGSATDDFQDMPLWRRSVSGGTRLVERLASGPVLVPMTFTSRDYFDEVVTDLVSRGIAPRTFCLRASLGTIEKRLENRKLDPKGREKLWLTRRIRECVEAHQDFYFGDPVDTDNRSAQEVADDILQRLDTNT